MDAKVDAKKKPVGRKRRWSTRLLLVLLFVLGFWAYQQLTLNYQNLEYSNQILASSLNNYVSMSNQYAQDIAKYKDNLAKAETKIKTIQGENNQLKKKLALMGTLNDLEATVEELKAKNLALSNELDDFKKKSPYVDPKNIKTIEEGKTILTKYKDSIHKVKERLTQINRDEQEKHVIAMKEQDRLESELGNGGYTLRDGKLTKRDVVLPDSKKNVNINVKFVE